MWSGNKTLAAKGEEGDKQSVCGQENASSGIRIMNNVLIAAIQTRMPMTIERLAWLTRLYRCAFHYQNTTRRAELLLRLPLQKLYRVCQRHWCFPQSGTFRYERLGQSMTICFDASNLQFHALYAGAYAHGYEQENAVLVDLLLPRGGNFYDIGSNWGYFTFYAASNHDRLTIQAFEPFPSSYADLVSCIRQAGLADIVTCHNCALSDQDGEAFIRLPDQLHSGLAELTADPNATRIIIRRLDSLRLAPPDLIKLDVEGHEIEVLRGGRETLQASWPFLIFENRRDYKMPGKTLAPLTFLTEMGYRLYIPALRRSLASSNYFLPCGHQMEINHMQVIEPQDCFALIPFEPQDRFLYQYDLNVIACHNSRQPQLQTVFSEC